MTPLTYATPNTANSFWQAFGWRWATRRDGPASLAAILAADMAVYSRLIGPGDESTLAVLMTLLRRELIGPPHISYG